MMIQNCNRLLSEISQLEEKIVLFEKLLTDSGIERGEYEKLLSDLMRLFHGQLKR